MSGLCDHEFCKRAADVVLEVEFPSWVCRRSMCSDHGFAEGVRLSGKGRAVSVLGVF